MSLSFTIYPSTVFRAVIAIHVYTVNSASTSWCCRVISACHSPIMKSCIVMQPFFTHDNSTTSVVPIMGRMWVVTASFHACPDIVYTIMRFSMGCLRFGYSVYFETATRQCMTISQIPRFYDYEIAAITLAIPNDSYIICGFIRSMQNQKPAEPLSSSSRIF